MQGLLSDAHDGNVDLLDAYTGALAEREAGSAMFAGPLLQVCYTTGKWISKAGRGTQDEGGVGRGRGWAVHTTKP